MGRFAAKRVDLGKSRRGMEEGGGGGGGGRGGWMRRREKGNKRSKESAHRERPLPF